MPASCKIFPACRLAAYASFSVSVSVPTPHLGSVDRGRTIQRRIGKHGLRNGAMPVSARTGELLSLFFSGVRETY